MFFASSSLVCVVALAIVSCCDSLVMGGSKPTSKNPRCQMATHMAMMGAMDDQTTQPSNDSITSRSSCIQNFRQAFGLPRIYRCASTDPLADVLYQPSLHEPERVLFHDTGLVLDLRSDIERDEEKAKRWTSRAPGSPFVVIDVEPETHVLSSSNNKDRRVLRIDVLSPARFMEYASDRWFTSSQKAMANFYGVFDAGKVHDMRIDALNDRGLTGLNEIILETGGRELCIALQEITIHLEQYESNVVIHCVQGKDR